MALIRSKFSGFPLFSTILLLVTLLYLYQNFAKIKDLRSALPFNPEIVETKLMSLDQANPHLIQYVRVKYLTPPSKLKYNMNKKLTPESSDKIERMIANFFNNKRGGTFIEAGAHDGDQYTHTYFLERTLGWRGLMAECNPVELPKLFGKNRKAWISNACISPTNHPGFLNFSTPLNYTIAGTLRKVDTLPERFQLKNLASKWTNFEVPAVPLYTLISALGWNEIDYLSFDIEGQELSALRHFPFDRVTFKVAVIELHILTKEEREELTRLMSANDYIFYRDVGIDRVFVHNSVKHLLRSDSFT